MLRYISVMLNIRYCLYMHSVDTAADSDCCVMRHVVCQTRCVTTMHRLQPSVPPQRLSIGHILETCVPATTAGDEGLNPKRLKIISSNRNLLHKTENFRPKFDFLLRIAEDRNTSETESRPTVSSIFKMFPLLTAKTPETRNLFPEISYTCL